MKDKYIVRDAPIVFFVKSHWFPLEFGSFGDSLLSMNMNFLHIYKFSHEHALLMNKKLIGVLEEEFELPRGMF